MAVTEGGGQSVSASGTITGITITTNSSNNNVPSQPKLRPPWYKQLWAIRLTLIVTLAPICFIPVPLVFPSAAGKCAYAILIMGTFWMTEVIPMAITALLPVVIFPWLGIMNTKDVCQNYLKDANMLFLGGLMVAVAVERWNLHKRIAMRVLMLVGSKPPWLMFGFMTTTAFLSMWISNTATTAMMIPIAHAVLTELSNHRAKAKSHSQLTELNGHQGQDVITMETFGPDSTEVASSKVEATPDGDTVDHATDGDDQSPSKSPGATRNSGTRIHPTTQPEAVSTEEQQSHQTGSSAPPKTCSSVDKEEEEEWFETVGKGMRLSIAYAANIGGTATLTGTGPNLVLKGQIDVLYGPESGINFSSWFIFAFPNMIISLALAWLWLMLLFIGPREIMKAFRRSRGVGDESDSAMDIIRAEHKRLGTMSFAEAMVLIHFIVMAVMWLTRDPEVVPGWGSLVPKHYVSDSCVAITISVLLFIVPSRIPNYLCFRHFRRSSAATTDSTPEGPAPALLDWPIVHKQIPWNVILLLGGGFALADGCKVSGLSQVIGQFFVSFQHFPAWVLVFVLSTMTAAFTEVTSNVATATIFLPILAELARSIQINPLYLMLPVTVAASFAFMLPVATPPNAIVFAYGNMKILDMMKAGIIMNVVCLVVLQLAINTWAYAYFGLGTFPRWASAGAPGHSLLDNSTTSAFASA
jgi:sodium-dependent dicarboxylate transporter 2/3/5